jgi:hypothetical protein
MKKIINIVTLCLALVVTLSISTFAKSGVTQASKALDVTEKLVKKVNASNPTMAKQFSSQLNKLKVKCSEEDSESACAIALKQLLTDLISGSPCDIVVSDCWDVIKKCFDRVLFAVSPNKAKSISDDIQANLRNTDNHLKKHNSKIKVINGQSLITSTVTI